MKAIIIKLFLFFLIISTLGIFYFIKIYPRSEISKLTDLELTSDFKIVNWIDNGEFYIESRLQIPPDKIKSFLEKNKLESLIKMSQIDKNHSILTIQKCLHQGQNYFTLKIESETGIAELKIEYPDMSGHLPCETEK